jgi:serine/threonine protein kinase
MRIGSRIGGYEVIRPLGAGGAGSVYHVRNVDSGQDFALKVLSDGHEFVEEIQNRYIREVGIAQRLNSPYLMSYTDSGYDEESGVLYYVMEYVPWGTLHDVLKRRGRLRWRDAVECGIQLCKGLGALQEQKIVHRDLKPANIFLSEKGQLKIGDFGLARDLESERLTLDGKTVGTLQYFAPEQAMGRTDLDVRTDLYALGCLLFEMVAGRTPFATAQPNELFECHVKRQPPKLCDEVADCPIELSELVNWLLAKAPADRPQTAAETEHFLAKILELPDSGGSADGAQRAISSLPIGPSSNAGAPSAPKSLTERLFEESQAAAAPQISTAKWLVVAGLLIALVAAAVFMRGS